MVRRWRDPRVRRSSRAVPALVALLLLLQLLTPYRGWLMLLVGLGGMWLIGYLWARSLARGLRVVREMRFGWAQVGDRLEERFTLVNEGWAPALWVEVLDRSDLPGAPASRVTGVGAYAKNRWRVERVCTRRGLFTLGPTSLRTGDPFGLYTVTLHNAASTTLLVTPPIVPLATIQVAPSGRAGEGRPRPHAPEPTVSAAGVRDYRPGDSLRAVHWRTSARRNALFVRLFDSTPAGDWWIFLDLEQRAQVGEGQDSTTEHGIILAASLADAGLRAGRAVGLVAHGRELVWLPPQVGEGQRWEILRTLALIEPGPRPLEELLAGARSTLRERASLIVITPAVRGQWPEALVRLLHRGALPTVLLLDPASFGGAGNARATQALLANLGIPCHLIPRTLLDRPEARPGKEGHWEWLRTPYGRAIAVRRPRNLAWRTLR